MANVTTRTYTGRVGGSDPYARGGCAGCGAPVKSACTCHETQVPCGCGELTCLCRPNWFPGQVLRDEDLKRLDRYILERFRRINLQFHGPGVVNGLEVRCDPCGPGVIVGCGHAISPCGDDIVVCEDAYADICELIQKCRQAERADCLPHQRPRSCPDVNEQWLLAIEYCERPTRGVLPLRREAAKGECGCVGKSVCECGGNGGGGTSKLAPRKAPPACEPTLLCEDFRFRICRPPDLPPACRGNDDDRDPETGEMLERMRCCVDALLASLPTPPPIPTSADQGAALSDDWYIWFCRVKEGLLDFVARYPASNCEAVADLQCLVCLRRNDFPSDSAYFAYWQETAQRLAIILIELLFNCICSGLLPPCPAPATSTSVPLAMITVSYASGSCRVASVCNWTRLRGYSANLRNLGYWLSFLPFGRELRRLLECICCDLLGDLFRDDDLRQTSTGATPTFDPSSEVAGGDATGATGTTTPPEASTGEGGEAGDGPQPPPVSARLRERLNRRLRPGVFGTRFDQLATAASRAARSAAPVEPLDAFVGLVGTTDDDRSSFFGSAGNRRETVLETLLLSTLGTPFLRGAAASPSLENFAFDLGNSRGSVSPGIGAASGSEEIAALRVEVERLRAEVTAMRRDSDL